MSTVRAAQADNGRQPYAMDSIRIPASQWGVGRASEQAATRARGAIGKVSLSPSRWAIAHDAFDVAALACLCAPHPDALRVWAVPQAAKRPVRHSAPTRVCRPNAQETHQRLNQASRLALLPLEEANGHSDQRAAPNALPRASDSMLGGLHQHMRDMQRHQPPTVDKKRSCYLDLVLQVRCSCSCRRRASPPKLSRQVLTPNGVTVAGRRGGQLADGGPLHQRRLRSGLGDGRRRARGARHPVAARARRRSARHCSGQDRR